MKSYISQIEIYDDEDGALQAAVTACDVCATVDLRDKTHTAESWSALSHAIAAAIERITGDQEASDA